MKQFRVYFEIYGKKMKATIIANNVSEAQIKVKDKIVFHKIVQEEEAKDPLKNVKDILGL